MMHLGLEKRRSSNLVLPGLNRCVIRVPRGAFLLSYVPRVARGWSGGRRCWATLSPPPKAQPTDHPPIPLCHLIPSSFPSATLRPPSLPLLPPTPHRSARPLGPRTCLPPPTHPSCRCLLPWAFSATSGARYRVSSATWLVGSRLACGPTTAVGRWDGRQTVSGPFFLVTPLLPKENTPLSQCPFSGGQTSGGGQGVQNGMA